MNYATSYQHCVPADGPSDEEVAAMEAARDDAVEQSANRVAVSKWLRNNSFTTEYVQDIICASADDDLIANARTLREQFIADHRLAIQATIEARAA
jgi:hypothetical protein